MIHFIASKYPSIVAETDYEAVDFYRCYGFFITSLGEKYRVWNAFYANIINNERTCNACLKEKHAGFHL
ncbi:hypothetical protein ACIQ7N_00915 [Lysinibacillus sp. NPDC095746]|uniref:hypothetical protein n=1 Tax=Lysinibacillus sp. NPDC095746 TaxID=3364134 RepID=UPI003801DA27